MVWGLCHQHFRFVGLACASRYSVCLTILYMDEWWWARQAGDLNQTPMSPYPLVREAPEASRQYKALAFLLVAQQNYLVRFYSWGHHTSWVQDTEESNWNWTGFFSLLRSFHSAKQCNADSKGFNPVAAPINCRFSLSGEVFPLDHYGGKQRLSDWCQGLLHKKESLPGSANLVNSHM